LKFRVQSSFRVRLAVTLAVTFGTAASSSMNAGLFGESKTSLQPWPDGGTGAGGRGHPSKKGGPGVRLLATQAQTAHYLVVTLYVRPLEIIQQAPALRDHLEQAAPRVIVFLVRLEMVSQFVNALAEQGYLDLWRSGVRFVRAKIRHDFLFCFFG
jgi:hypothetical protein